jgi:UDP-2-acetamido-3-amino-2,3-dideoxy-glucuronate N-acetyltransferase
VHDDAILGDRVIVWHGARVLAGVVLGDHVSIGGGAEIGRGSSVGAGSRIGAGAFLPSNSTIGEDVFIGPHAVFCDDKYPRVLSPGETYTAEPPTVKRGASIGANVTVLPGITIGEHAMVGAGAVVTHDVPDGMLVYGSPARIIGPNPNLTDR